MRLVFSLSLIALLFFACSKSEKTGQNADGSPATTHFECLSPERSGISFTPAISEDYRYNFSMDPYIYNGGGVAVIDVNNDGLQDLLFTARLQGCRLYLNKGNLKFEDISESAGIARHGGLKTGVTVTDVNADGWPDLYICRTWLEPLPERRNLLLVNDGLKNGAWSGTFTDQAAQYGLDDLSASQHAVFSDYDLDGDLDCYVVNHPTDFKTINNLDYAKGSAAAQPPRNEYESDRLYRNEGPGKKFSDVSKAAGIQNRAFGLSVLAGDFNDDGYPDFFVGNDFVMPDFLYLNQKNGTFKDEAARVFAHQSNHTMGADWADLNADGNADLLTLDMLADPWPRRKRLMSTMQLERDRQMQRLGYGLQTMRNTLHLMKPGPGLPRAQEIGCLAGLYATDWSWSPLLADLDNDGHRDVFITNGIKRDLNDLDFFVYTADSVNRTGGINPARFKSFEAFSGLIPGEPQHNYCFQNKGDLQFEEVSEKWGFGQKDLSNGAALADLDNDGDLDLITNRLEMPVAVWENKAVQQNQYKWLQIKCKGSAANPFGLGAKVRVYAGGKLLFAQEMMNVRGFYSCSEPILQVGLGNFVQADRVEIDWPEKRFQVLENVAAGQRLVLDLQQAQPGKCPPATADAGPPLFKTQANAIAFVHRENAFEDFDREKMLTHRFSDDGPALAVADVNGDHLDDVFLGGAAGQSAELWLQQANGKFSKSAQAAFEPDAPCEDVCATFFDADGDGDQDLYVGSGGNELPAGAPLYQDRLYLNDGKGRFGKSTEALPQENESAGAVLAADLDGDGDQDLVLGSRVTPGRYPETPRSMILKNEGGKFSDASAVIAPAFERIGMVSALAWADLDGDRQPELIVAGDWMPIQVFKRQGSQYTLVSAAMGLQALSGWFNCVVPFDADGDGDLDLFAGNEGLNTRFKASLENPLRLYASDFDKNGSIDPLLTLVQGKNAMPLFSRDQLSQQMLPVVKKLFPRHVAYANAPISAIFDEKTLKSGLVLEANCLQNGWFENKNGQFEWHALSNPAQIAPVQDALSADFNGDGRQDLLLLGNDFGTDIETYRLDASEGLLLLGDGKSELVPLAAKYSGLNLNGDARKVLLVRGAANSRKIIVAMNNAPAALLWY